MKPISELMGDIPDPPTFEQWKEAYPKGRRQGLKKAKEKFDKLSPEQKSACYLGTVHHAENNPQWADETYVPMMTTFLNQERWNDEIALSAKEQIKVGVAEDAAGLVWKAMVEFYGNRWIKEHGPKPSEIWRKMLKPLPEYRLKRGLRKVFESGSDFPPSLPKFMEYCARTFGESCDERLEWDNARLKALPQLPSDPIKSSDAFKQMFDILGVKANE